MSDEGFHEIQLNGKQLVFLFMATTVVLVLTFLFGVIVGRNARPGATETAGLPSEVTADPIAAQTAEPAAPAPSSAPPARAENAAPKPVEELSYPEQLLREDAAKEKLKPAGSTPPPAAAQSREAAGPSRDAGTPPRDAAASREQPSAAREKPAPEPTPVKETAAATPAAATPPAPRPAPAAPPPAPAEATKTVAAAPSSDPSGPGFAVQVAAYKDRKESDTLAKELIAKGYPAFVMEPVKGAPTAFFRVRVGKYKTLKDAQAIMAKLQGQFSNAWIAK